MTLDGSASSGGKVWYRWLQTQGPKVAHPLGADQAVAQFAVPEGATMLGFVLVVGNTAGVDARSVRRALKTPSATPTPRSRPTPALDQIVTVGRRVDARRRPRASRKGGSASAGSRRAGPRIKDAPRPRGPTCSFVSRGRRGSYQFALLVARGERPGLRRLAGQGQDQGGASQGRGTAPRPTGPRRWRSTNWPGPSLTSIAGRSEVRRRAGPDLRRRCRPDRLVQDLPRSRDRYVAADRCGGPARPCSPGRVDRAASSNPGRPA